MSKVSCTDGLLKKYKLKVQWARRVLQISFLPKTLGLMPIDVIEMLYSDDELVRNEITYVQCFGSGLNPRILHISYV